jgi:hypothetical protein
MQTQYIDGELHQHQWWYPAQRILLLSLLVFSFVGTIVGYSFGSSSFTISGSFCDVEALMATAATAALLLPHPTLWRFLGLAFAVQVIISFSSTFFLDAPIIWMYRQPFDPRTALTLGFLRIPINSIFETIVRCLLSVLSVWVTHRLRPPTKTRSPEPKKLL